MVPCLGMVGDYTTIIVVGDKVSVDHLVGDKVSVDQLVGDKVSVSG